MRAEAAAALGGFGARDREVVEALVASLDREQATNPRFAPRHRSGSRQGLGGRSQLPRGTLRANVAVALGKLAARPDLSIPAIVKMLDLGYMGSSERCDLAATALAEFGEDATFLIPDLVEKLHSRASPQPALTALRRLDPGLSQTVQQLTDELASNDDATQLRSILLLAKLREKSTPAMAPLQEIADGEDETMAAWAAYALWKIAPESHSLKPAFPVLIQVLENPKTEHLNKFSVLSELASIGSEARPAAPAIRMAIERGDFGRSGEMYLKKIEPEAFEASHE